MTEPAAADVTTALPAKFPSASPRPSGDHPAFNLPITEVVAALQWLRDEKAYDFLVDVTAIDWAEAASPRFSAVWHLYSTTQHGYVRIVADCADDVDPVAIAGSLRRRYEELWSVLTRVDEFVLDERWKFG